MPIEAGEIKTGMTLLIDGEIVQVIDFQHVKPGKGAALLKTKLRNLRTGAVKEQNFNTNIRFDTAMIEKKPVTFSYEADGIYYFMDSETFDTYELTAEQIGFAKNFITEEGSYAVKFFESEIMGLEIPEKMELKVVDTIDAAVAGNTATNCTKDAIVETGLLVKVPLFIKQGEKIIVSTRDGSYSSRA